VSDNGVDLDRVIHGTLLGEGVLNATVAALLADDEGRYVAVNDEACRLTGFKRSELTSARMGALGADTRSRAIYTNIARGHQLQGNKQVRRNDGRIVSCRYWAVPTRVARVAHFVLLLWPLEGATAHS
jgi:PAS domain S-box-containing protein